MLVPARFRAQHVALRTGYIAGGGGIRSMSARLDIVLLRADDSEVPVDVALCTIPHDDDQLVVATIRDATTRRRAELGVERERSFLSAMHDVSSALLEAGDVDGTLDLVTRRARTLLDADLAMLVLPDPDEENALVVRVADGLAARELLGSTLPADHSMAGLALRALRALEERERMADSLRDTVANRLYSVSLTLHLILQGELPQPAIDRIWTAIDELDETVTAMRNAIFPR